MTPNAELGKQATTGKHERRRSDASATGNGQTTLSDEELRRMIAEAAYMRAAQRGFLPGRAIEDWLAAEQEILSTLEGTTAPREVAPARSNSRQEDVLPETTKAGAVVRSHP